MVELRARKPARWFGLDDEVGGRREPAIGLLVFVAVEVEREARLATVVPPVEQAAPRRRVVGPHVRAVGADAHAHDGRTGFGEQLGREAAAVVGQINHA